MIDADICPFEEDFEFSTGYDQLVARIVAMELLYAFLSFRRTYLQSGDDGALVHLLKVKGMYKWTGSLVQLAELLYALDEVKCINNGEVSISEWSETMKRSESGGSEYCSVYFTLPQAKL